MEEFEIEDEIKAETKIDSYQYNCTECTSLIEIISLNDQLNEIEFRCLNNSHRIKKALNDYLNEMKSYQYSASFKTKCESAGHNNSNYEYYCLNCDKHLCKICLESKEHLYHIKFNIMSEISLSKEQDNLIKMFIEDKNKSNQIENYNDIKELITMTYYYYTSNKDNYYLATNLINIILCCCKNSEGLKNELGFKEVELNKLMKFDKKYLISNIEAQLNLITNIYNNKMEILNQNKNLTIEKINLIKKCEYDDGTYIGEFNQKLKEGRGRFEYKNGDIYEGEWKNDQREGKGVYTFQNGNIYEGDFKNDKQNGKGVFVYSQGKVSGDKFEGDFVDGKMDGNGVYWFSNGDRQMGNFKQGNPIGKHVIIQVNGDIIQTEF
jgi:hypothetical protein